MLIFILFLPIVNSQLPSGLQKAWEETALKAQKITLIIAFLGGMLSFLSPCILPILPAFFSYTFKERKKITKMTFVFFLGFSLVFISLGILVSLAGKTIVTFQNDISNFVFIAGIILILLGVMSIFGKGFSSFIKIRKKPGTDIPGIFLFGSLFALGWTPCVGPILAGILILASVFSPIKAALLLSFYSLGIFIPLFLLSFFFDKLNLAKLIKGKTFTFKILDKKFITHTSNIIAGILLIILGGVFVFYRSTSPFLYFNFFTSITENFYSLQRKLLELNIPNYIYIIIVILILLIAIYKLRRIIWKK